MTQRRNRRAGVEDLWTKRDGTPSARHGRGMRWRARYVDNLGKEHSKSFSRKIEAQGWLDAQTTALGTNTHVDPHVKVTVEQVAERYLAGLGHLSPKTLYQKKSLLNSRVLPRWKGVQVREIRPSDVDVWVADLVHEDLSSSLVRKCVETLRHILDVAMRDQQLAVNPAAGVKLPRDSKEHSAVFLSPKQLRALAEACSGYSELVWLLGVCGLRWSEATALQVRDLDFERHRVSVSKAHKNVAGKMTVGATKTGKARFVPMPKTLETMLKALVEGRDQTDLVFTSAHGAPLRSENFRNRVFRPAVESLESIPDDMWLYDLRHTAASIAIKSGANIKVIQAMLGHSSATLTLDRYGHLFPDDFDGLAEALENTAY